MLRHLISPSWQKHLGPALNDRMIDSLFRNVAEEYDAGECFPPKHNIFRALDEVEPQSVKVVILGQDPYINPGEALGMAFAVPDEMRPKPPSLMNIFKELETDLGLEKPLDKHRTSLQGWARQGVLLLNAALTVRRGQSGSHSGLGWTVFTNLILASLQKNPFLVFLLWGRNAQHAARYVTNPNHLVLTAAHPSPLSAYKGFLGCRHFSQTNDYLFRNGLEPIDWTDV